jgi:hypothetical protein
LRRPADRNHNSKILDIQDRPMIRAKTPG